MAQNDVSRGNFFENQNDIANAIQNLDSSGNLVGASQTAPAAPGLTGTSSFGAPTLERWEENSVIISQYKIDMTGLASVATANDVIGLSVGGIAYLDQVKAAEHGVVFKASLACLETPAGGDDDINVVVAISGTLEYDGAGGTSYVINGGDQLAGQIVENDTIGSSADLYMYLTAGTGDTAAAYTAGQLILTLYGHAALA